jgi:hypothetical protein
MQADEVILGGEAKAFAKRIGLPETDVREARASAVSELGGTAYMILQGTLPDGRSVRLVCRYDLPHYVVSFRPL